MKGILLYTPWDAAYNKKFIAELTETGKKLDLKLCLETVERDGQLPVCDGADFVLNRSRYFQTAQLLEQRGIRCFNNAKTVEIANDKWKTYRFAEALGLPVMESELLLPDRLPERIPYPCILKTLDGHGGSEVFFCHDRMQAEKIRRQFAEKPLLAQKPASRLGCDIRAYVIGEKVLIAMKRQSADDFRSNFSLGGNAVPTDLTVSQIEIIQKIRENLQTDYVGIDFIFDRDRWVLNEIEDAVGARMVYRAGRTDLADRYLKWVKQNLSR